MTTESSTRRVSEATAWDLLYDVVSIPSVSGDEAAVAHRLREFFDAHDRDSFVDDVGNVRAPGNEILVTSHIDTVPGDVPVRRSVEPMEVADSDPENTTSAVDSVTGIEVLSGRGAVDAKGSSVAMAVAAIESGASFAGVVGEETDSRGARFLLEDRTEPAFLVNGEPSGWDAFTIGYRGLLGGRFIATSRHGHASRPEPNAIQDAIRWWDDVEEAFGGDGWESVVDSVTPKPTAIVGGVNEDGLAVETTMDVQLRIPARTNLEAVKERAEQLLDRGTVHWSHAIPPVELDYRTPVARAFRAAIRDTGGEPRMLRKSGTSDMNLYAQQWSCPMVTYGPGDSNLDHAPDEQITRSEFERAVDVLRAVCNRLDDQY